MVNPINPDKSFDVGGIPLSSDINAAKKIRTDRSQTEKASSTPPADSIVLSQQAQDLKTVKSNLAQVPESQNRRLDEIARQVSEGRYQINVDKIAAKIIRDKKDDPSV